MPDRLLDADLIARLLGEVAAELAGDQQRLVVVVGGALLATRGLREATRDVDSAVQLDAQLTAAVKRVADRHDLAPRWLNGAAAPYLPATFDRTSCTVLLNDARLVRSRG